MSSCDGIMAGSCCTGMLHIDRFNRRTSTTLRGAAA